MDLSSDEAGLGDSESIEKNMDLKGNLEPLLEVDLNSDLKMPLGVEFEEGSGEPSVRSKTSLRMNYEAQVQVVKNQLGDLEEIRLNLGLSQRKMAQLLMIDPSSWTRWVKKGDEAPPHIWRALQWYSIIQEKIPGLTAHYFSGNSPKVLHAESLRQIYEERITRQNELFEIKKLLQNEVLQKNSLENDIKKLKKDLNFHRNVSILILSISLLWAGLFFWNFL